LSGLGGVASRQVLIYTNGTSGENRQPSKIASYSTSGGGRWTGTGVGNPEALPASQAVTLRPPAGEVANTKVTIVRPY
jgi:hypothetical protein